MNYDEEGKELCRHGRSICAADHLSFDDDLPDHLGNTEFI